MTYYIKLITLKGNEMTYQFIATTKEWRDKVNGNSYFSSVVEDLEGNVVLKLPFQYG